MIPFQTPTFRENLFLRQFPTFITPLGNKISPLPFKSEEEECSVTRPVSFLSLFEDRVEGGVGGGGGEERNGEL